MNAWEHVSKKNKRVAQMYILLHGNELSLTSNRNFVGQVALYFQDQSASRSRPKRRLLHTFLILPTQLYALSINLHVVVFHVLCSWAEEWQSTCTVGQTSSSGIRRSQALATTADSKYRNNKEKNVQSCTCKMIEITRLCSGTKDPVTPPCAKEPKYVA